MPPIVEETRLEGQHRMTKKTTLQSFAPLVLAILAIILGTVPTLNCETVRFVQTTTATTTTTEGTGLVLLAGPFQYRTQGDWQVASFSSSSTSCRGYGDLDQKYETDAITKTLWVLSVLTPLLGAALIIKAFFRVVPGFGGAACSKGGKTCLGILLVAVAILQGLTVFLIPQSSICKDNPSLQYLEALSSDLASTFSTTTQDNDDDDESYSCELMAGFFLQVVAAVLWLLAGVVTLFSPEPIIVVHEHRHQEQTVTYTQNIENGTIEEARVAIVKGRPVAQKSIE